MAFNIQRLWDGAEEELGGIPIAATPPSGSATFDETLGGTVSAAHLLLDPKASGALLDAGAAEASDTEEIATFLDQTANNFDAAQSSSGARPVVNADGINSNKTISGASGDFFQFADRTILKDADSATIGFLFKYVSTGTYQTILRIPTGDGSFGNRLYPYIASDDKINVVVSHPDGTDGSIYSNDTFTDGTIHALVIALDFLGNAYTIYIDDVNVHSGSLGGTNSLSNTNADEDITLFASDPYASNTFRSEAGILVIYKDQYFNSTQASALHDEMVAYYGTPGATTEDLIVDLSSAPVLDVVLNKNKPISTTLTPTFSASVTLTQSMPLQVTVTPATSLSVVLNRIRGLSQTLSPAFDLSCILNRSIGLTETLSPDFDLTAVLTDSIPLQVTLSSEPEIDISLNLVLGIAETLEPGFQIEAILSAGGDLVVTLAPDPVIEVTLTLSQPIQQTLAPSFDLSADLTLSQALNIGLQPDFDLQVITTRTQNLTLTVSPDPQLTVSLNRVRGLSVSIAPEFELLATLNRSISLDCVFIPGFDAQIALNFYQGLLVDLEPGFQIEAQLSQALNISETLQPEFDISAALNFSTAIALSLSPNFLLSVILTRLIQGHAADSATFLSLGQAEFTAQEQSLEPAMKENSFLGLGQEPFIHIIKGNF